jgi:hypothetical protein
MNEDASRRRRGPLECAVLRLLRKDKQWKGGKILGIGYWGKRKIRLRPSGAPGRRAWPMNEERDGDTRGPWLEVGEDGLGDGVDRIDLGGGQHGDGLLEGGDAVWEFGIGGDYGVG